MKLLKKLVLVSAVLLLAAAEGHARPRLIPRRTCVSPAPARVVSVPQYDAIPAPAVPVPAIPPQVVLPAVGEVVLPQRATGDPLQRHAERMASAGQIFHSGQLVPGAVREGVGFSTFSPADAVRRCCFAGQCPPVGVAVSAGPGGYYAVQQYGR